MQMDAVLARQRKSRLTHRQAADDLMTVYVRWAAASITADFILAQQDFCFQLWDRFT